MDYQWQYPFKLALELLAFLVGWTLVAIIIFFIIAVAIGLYRAITESFKKSKNKVDEQTDKESTPSKSMLGVVEPPDNLNAFELKKLFERE